MASGPWRPAGGATRRPPSPFGPLLSPLSRGDCPGRRLSVWQRIQTKHTNTSNLITIIITIITIIIVVVTVIVKTKLAWDERRRGKTCLSSARSIASGRSMWSSWPRGSQHEHGQSINNSRHSSNQLTQARGRCLNESNRVPVPSLSSVSGPWEAHLGLQRWGGLARNDKYITIIIIIIIIIIRQIHTN